MKQNITAWTKSENLNGCTINGVVEVKLLKTIYTDKRLGKSDFPTDIVLAPDGNEYSVLRDTLYRSKELDNKLSSTPCYKSVSCNPREFLINRKGNCCKVSAAIETVDYTGKDEATIRFTTNSEWSEEDEIVPESAYTWYTRIDTYNKLEETLYTYEDGHTETRGGEYRKFIIPDNKMKLIEKLRKAIVACQEAGIKLNYDTEDSDIYGYYDPENLTVCDEVYRDSDVTLPSAVLTSVCDLMSSNSDWAPQLKTAE